MKKDILETQQKQGRLEDAGEFPKVVLTQLDLSMKAAPLIRLGDRGDFYFQPISDKKDCSLRVISSKGGLNGEREIQFGYTLKENGFSLKLEPGQNVIFMVSARVSKRSNKPTTLFIQDKAETWERNSVTVNTASWEQSLVSKRIREGASVVNFGIYWQPTSENEWLEIKDVRIFVEP